MKEKALEIANWLETGEVERYDIDEASAMIRRLVEELDKQTYKADLLENRLRVITGKSQAEIDRLNLELGNPIDHDEWGKHQMAVDEPIGRFYWESVVEGHVVALPSEGTPHYQFDDFPLYTTPQTKPLSQSEFDDILDLCNRSGDYDIYYDFEKMFELINKTIEERNRIK